MLVAVQHVDGAGVKKPITQSISLLQFIKHGALAGQGPGATFFPTLTRGIGLLLFYQEYIRVDSSLSLTGFNLTAGGDPTELGDFSTIAGKAFADILAKKVLGAPFTFTYEAALAAAGYPVVGVRPDFYCPSPSGQFSLESKGRKGASPKSLMAEAKKQSQAGVLPVSFSYASVTFDLYNKPKCHFHDPIQRAAPEDIDLHRSLARRYYDFIIRDLLNSKQWARKRLGERDFLAYRFQTRWGAMEFLVDREIESRLHAELPTDDVVHKGFEPINNERFYIDRDGVGISFG